MSKRNPMVKPASKAVKSAGTDQQILVPAEVRRLKDIIQSIPGQRLHLVNRRVIVSRSSEPSIRYEDVTFHVRAATMAEAGRAADNAKYDHEFRLGHHHGKKAA